MIMGATGKNKGTEPTEVVVHLINRKDYKFERVNKFVYLAVAIYDLWIYKFSYICINSILICKSVNSLKNNNKINLIVSPG